MIRRNAGDDWLLISQVEHARIAAEIAAAWGHEQQPALPLRGLLLHAIRHHDDGWTDWEQAPTLVPETGEPRNFLEMPLPTAVEIWSRSIDLCARHSAWCGLWVSRHFAALAEHARDHREARSDRDAASTFLQVQSERQRHWRCQLAGNPDADNLRSLEETGYAWLRWFDLLSLWLCCHEHSEPEALTVPGAGCIELIPANEHAVMLCPYPLRPTSLRITVPAVRIPRCRFNSDDELRQALRQAARCDLFWTLLPA